MNRLFSLLLAGLLTQACVADVNGSKYPKPLEPNVVLHGDVAFSKSERASIETAAGTWHEQTGGQANITIVWDLELGSKEPETNYIRRADNKDLDVVMIDCEISEANGLEPCSPTLLGWVNVGGGIHSPGHELVSVNFIPDRYDSGERFVSVAIHEFGHMFGLPHSPAPQNVMYPSQNAIKTCLKQADLASFCQTNVCDGREMHPCE